MPRKQNGFGSSKSFAFKGVNKDPSAGLRKSGNYPRFNTFGSVVTRSVIDQYNLDSDWTKWRKGYEYYSQASWYRLEDYNPITKEYVDSRIDSKLYQGTPYATDIHFDGYKFATKNSDTGNHYVMKRTIDGDVNLGVITGVWNDELLYPEQKKYNEIWTVGAPGPQRGFATQCIGERITDGETEATLNWILKDNQRPAVYIGKSDPERKAIVTARFPKSELSPEWLENNNFNYQALVNEVVYLTDLTFDSRFTDQVWEDRPYEWLITLDGDAFSEIRILDSENELLPPTIYDISTLDEIGAAVGSYNIKGSYVFDKNKYQRFYGKQYITADVIQDEVETFSVTTLPYIINAVEERGDNLLLQSTPFTSEIKLYAPPDKIQYLAFTDHSFTRTEEQDNGWKSLITDINPWMDEVFTSGNNLKLADTYSCSCPNFAHAQLRMPQSTTQEAQRKVNRQLRYPLPTAQGRKTFDQLGLTDAAGIVESWETRKQRMGFRMCKHTVAAMFIEDIKVREPNSYPSEYAREEFEFKLNREVAEVAEEFRMSYRRGGITALEVIFAMGSALNFGEVEQASIVLQSQYSYQKIIDVFYGASINL